jgi:hypothetical protein
LQVETDLSRRIIKHYTHFAKFGSGRAMQGNLCTYAHQNSGTQSGTSQRAGRFTTGTSPSTTSGTGTSEVGGRLKCCSAHNAKIQNMVLRDWRGTTCLCLRLLERIHADVAEGEPDRCGGAPSHGQFVIATSVTVRCERSETPNTSTVQTALGLLALLGATIGRMV